MQFENNEDNGIYPLRRRKTCHSTLDKHFCFPFALKVFTLQLYCNFILNLYKQMTGKLKLKLPNRLHFKRKLILNKWHSKLTWLCRACNDSEKQKWLLKAVHLIYIHTFRSLKTLDKVFIKILRFFFLQLYSHWV